MIRILACAILLFVTVTGDVYASGKPWLVYERCELADETYYDGDSFSVKVASGYIYVFRLYGVDCPETDRRVKSRLIAQGKDFGLAEKELLKWGRKASAFTRKFLRKPFTVFTQKVKAGGASKKNRYYAIVVNAEGKRLDEALVEAGLARAYGMGAAWDDPFWRETHNDLPHRMTSKRFIGKLHALESKAKRARAGVWGH